MSMNQGKSPLSVNHNTHYFSSDTIRVSEAMTLEVIQPSMASDLFNLVQSNQERLSYFLAWPQQVVSVEDTQAFIRKQSADHHSGVSKTYTMRYQGRVSGILSLNAIDSAHQTTTIGYWIDASLEGKGVVSAALNKLIEHYSQAGIIHKFIINCGVTNRKSNSLAHRNGFHFVGVIQQAEQIKGKWIDHNSYAKVI
jgi:ribosomal-protein-serine acetyltransferase